MAYFGTESQEGPCPTPHHPFSLCPLSLHASRPRPAHPLSLTLLRGWGVREVLLPEAARLDQVLGQETCDRILTAPPAGWPSPLCLFIWSGGRGGARGGMTSPELAP